MDKKREAKWWTNTKLQAGKQTAGGRRSGGKQRPAVPPWSSQTLGKQSNGPYLYLLFPGLPEKGAPQDSQYGAGSLGAKICTGVSQLILSSA